MVNQATIRYLSDVHFGSGMAERLPGLLVSLQAQRPLVITDQGVLQLGLVEQLGLAQHACFHEVETNPTEAMAWAAVALYRAQHCDSLVVVGGGSPMDLAKCVAILIKHPPPLAQYAVLNGGAAKISADLPPLIFIPTTAGSGSEIGRAALLTLSNGSKVGFVSDHLLPDATICDPQLTLALPPALTAACGMDAISHCVETFCSPVFNPVADAIALDGLERGYHAIVRATRAGNDLDARTDMMLCSLQGGLAFQKSLGAVHSLSHPLGALSERCLHHGALNAIFLPHVLRFNQEHCVVKMRAMAVRLGFAPETELASVFAQLNRDLALPQGLRELGLTREELIPLAAKAWADHCTPTNPRALTVADCAQLYLDAW